MEKNSSGINETDDSKFKKKKEKISYTSKIIRRQNRFNIFENTLELNKITIFFKLNI